MAATTIIDYATDRRDDAKQAVTDAQSELAVAQTAIANTAEQLTDETALLVSLDKSVADIRQKLSVVPTPADGETLLAALEQLTIRQRAAQSSIVELQAGIAVAQSNAAQAQADLARANTQLTTAETDLTRATDASNRRDDWKTALAAEPLKSIDTAATKALDPNTSPEGDVFEAATLRIAEIPQTLRERAQDRRAAEAARIAAAAKNTKTAGDAVAAEHNTNSGLSAQAADLWVAFLAIESATGDFVASSVTRFEQAQAALAGVADITNSPLTAEQTASINDASLQAARDTAAAAEETVQDARKDVEDKQAILDGAVVAAKAAPTDLLKAQAVQDAEDDVAAAQTAFNTANDAWIAEQKDYLAAITDVEEKQAALNAATLKAVAAQADPTTDPDVIAATSDLAAAQQTLTTAEAAYKASSNGILHAWEAAVPDATWRLFDDYEEAQETLNALKAPSAAARQTALDNAEAAYVAAQLEADASVDVLSQLVALQETRAARAAAAQQAATARLFSALRGDN
ncbi:MAG TPA: hypothetical protein VGO56_10590 [Pyrinomonadaceae bacterium]|jgi:hypothetical protein|nr:hypothetical protein [Pyrinomonadaceae bacterium]